MFSVSITFIQINEHPNWAHSHATKRNICAFLSILVF